MTTASSVIRTFRCHCRRSSRRGRGPVIIIITITFTNLIITIIIIITTTTLLIITTTTTTIIANSPCQFGTKVIECSPPINGPCRLGPAGEATDEA